MPFAFDVHAMIYSDNAPDLESMLHAQFDVKRVNLVNSRKEFYHVSLEEIQSFLREKGVQVEFTKLAEAKEYRETLSIRNRRAPEPVKAPPAPFPQSLFAEPTHASA